MKTATDVIKNCLAAESTQVCDLYTLVLESGETYRFTSFDRDVSYDGNMWTYRPFLFQRGQVKLQGAPSVDTLSVTVYCTPDDKLGDVTFMAGCHNGLLDQSMMQLCRAYFSDGECIGIVPVFSGKCEVNQSGGLAVKLNVKSIIQGLAAPLPVRMFAAQAAYANSNGVIVVSENDTTSMVIPLKPSGNVLVRM